MRLSRRAVTGVATMGTIAAAAVLAPAALAGKPPPPPPPPVTATVQFAPGTPSSVGESGGALSVTLQRNTTGSPGSMVHVQTFDGTATTPSDYTAVNMDFEIPAASSKYTFTVPITPDSTAEKSETFVIKLTPVSTANPEYAQVDKKKNTLTVTINDDDPCPAVSVNDASATEGSPITFTVSTAGAAMCALPIQVHWATVAGGTATADTDYPNTPVQQGNVAIPAGGVSTTFNVATTHDTTDEPDETVNVHLSAPVNTSFADADGVGTITDNDAAPFVTVDDNPTVVEGNALQYTLKLSAVSGKDASGTVETWPGNVSDVRYTPTGATAWNIPAGSTTTTFNVPTTDNNLPEADAVVWSHILTAVNAQIDTGLCSGDWDCTNLGTDDAWGFGTLQDNDNGGLETGDFTAWSTENSGAGPLPSVDGSQFHSGAYSALLGTDGVSGDEPGDGFSYLYRQITIPASGTTTLSVWVLEHGDNNFIGDDQFGQIKDLSTNVLATIFDDTATFNAAWQHKTIDLSPWAGQTVYVLFGVHQDIPGGDPTAMWVDDLQITHTP